MTLEGNGRLSEAMGLYERALELPEGERGPFDVGRTLHRMGTCAAKMSDWDRAFCAHVLAARKARELAMTKPCGASLAAAGSTLVDSPPLEPLRHAVAEDLAWAAFNGVVEQIREILLEQGARRLADVRRLHAQFADVVALSAYVALETAPLNASKALFHLVVTPFAERHGIHRDAPVDEAFVTTLALEGLALLCSSVAKQGRLARKGTMATEEDVATMVGHAARASVGPTKGRTLGWLGVYLRNHRGAVWATDERIGALAAERWG